MRGSIAATPPPELAVPTLPPLEPPEELLLPPLELLPALLVAVDPPELPDVYPRPLTT